MKRGFNPNLKCPDPFCQSPVTAKKGSIRDHHFAHSPENGCTGYESMLHILAKEVLKELEKFELPDYKLYFNELIPYFKDEINSYEKKLGFQVPDKVYYSYEFSHCLTNWDKAAIQVFPGCTLDLSDIDLFVEKSIKDMTPDLRLQLKNTDRNLHIEIYVTHKVENKKKERLTERNLCFLEIDLSNYFKSSEDYSIEYVKSILVNKRYLHNWLHFPNLEKFLKRNRQSILNEMLSRVKVFYDDYVEFKNEELIPEIRNFERDPNYAIRLIMDLKKDRSKKYKCLEIPEFYYLYIAIFQNSSEFSEEISNQNIERQIRKNDFVSRWGEDVYKKIYGKW
ncbi:competence protein CoiA family protein [Gillisia mitskevichiae]|uniref:competence protein CoiA family protein n=1 Tax=Gillisia mitskevichiae TaxID=270921 RepID=UPI0016045C8C|nr:competence protein CoiA family protein [Gillisia mitskevichiae]